MCIFLVIFIIIIIIKYTTITYYHNDDHFHRYHNHCYLVRSNVIFDVRRKGEGDYKWYLLGPSNGVTAIIAPTQHYITPRDRGRITISWLVLGLCITMCNIYFQILSFENFRAFLSSQAGRITQYLKCFFFSSCIGWETQSEMLKWMMSDDTDSRRWQNTAVRECICWASDGGGEAKTGKGTQHSGHNKQVGLAARCRLPAN